MTKSTEDVETLVISALDKIKQPYSPDVIEDVFVAIEQSSTMLERYQALRRGLGPDMLNQWIGKYTQRHVNMAVAGHGTPTRTSLITSYSRLTSRRQIITH